MQWFILRVEGRKVKQAADILGGYVPTMERLTKPAKKKQPVVSRVPIFPGWVFVPYQQHLYRAAGLAPGVRGFMRYGRQGLLLLSEGDMARLKAIEDQQLPATTPSGVPVIAVGDQVQVSGLLQGMTGVVLELTGSEAVVDVGGNYPVTVDCCLLLPVDVNIRAIG